MEIFSFIADCLSIVSFLISIFVANKVYKISKNTNIFVDNSRRDKSRNTVEQNAFGQSVTQIGRDKNAR